MGQIPIHWGTARGKGVQEISLAATICIAISSHMQTDDSAVHCKFFTDLIVRLSALWLCALLLSALFSHLELGRSVAYSRTWRCLRNSSWRWPKACSTASSLRFKHVVRILLIGNLYSWFHCKYMRIGRGPRYMICVTLLAHCASQKIHGHARIETRARLACPCVFWLAQRAKSCDKIWYLGPLPTYEHVLIFFLNLSIAASFPGQSCRAGASCLCSGGKKNNLQSFRKVTILQGIC